MKPKEPSDVPPKNKSPNENCGDWRWQLRNAATDLGELNQRLKCITSHRVQNSQLIDAISDEFQFKVTPHMVNALRQALENGVPDSWEAFKSSFLPTESEIGRISDASHLQGAGTDCIGEESAEANPTPSVTNFYENRVLFRVTTMCPAYCRYCFRRRMVSDGVGAWDSSSIEKGLEYISDNPDVREVILSGGDPLILSNSRLRFVLDSLESIPHIKRIRIDTKAFTMMPQRITEDLASLLSNYQPFYLIGHFSHPYELVPETLDACKRLVNSGIPVLSHTPLLRGVNDEEETLVSLLQSLADNRIIPYYLIQFIPTKWTEHFRVSIERALELVRHIHDSCGGIATPTYIVYLPDAGGKVPVTPGYLVEKRSEGYLFETIDGRRVVYPEPTEESPSTSRYSTSDNGSP